MDLTLCHEQTLNKRGFMHPISEISQEFINFSTSINTPVVDLGCAFGITTLAALQSGAYHVIACDMENAHLDILKERLLERHLSPNRLSIKQAKFPDDIDLRENTIGAVLASYVLPYLTPDELDRGLTKIFNWLAPEGKLFILSYSIFIKEFANEKFKNEYTKRIKSGIKWPGYFEDFNQFSSLADENLSCNALPSQIHFFDIQPLINGLSEIGFEIEEARYLDGKTNGAVEDTLNDGRELVAVIAKKPK